MAREEGIETFHLAPSREPVRDAGTATAPPNSAVTPKPPLQPQHLLEVARPYWQGHTEDEHRVIPALLSTYASVMTQDQVRASLNWMRFQRQDMARFLAELIARWRGHGYSPENIR